MGFYNDKLKAYSKVITLDKDELKDTKESVVVLKKIAIDELRKEIDFFRSMRNNGILPIVEGEKKLKKMQEELDFISSLNPNDFMQFMINVEGYRLRNMSDRISSDISKYSQSLSNYQNKKGFLGKASVVFGVNKRIIVKKSNLIKNEKNRLEYYNNEYNEWNSLSPEKQATYIAGRSLYERLADFDKNGHSAQANKFIEQKEKTSETNEREM